MTINAKSIGELLVRALGLQPGDDVTISRDRLDSNRLLVVRTVASVVAHGESVWEPVAKQQPLPAELNGLESTRRTERVERVNA